MTTKLKLSSERKKSLRKLANLMNSLNAHPLPVTGHLLKCFDIAISPKETDFLLKVNKKPRSYKQLLKFSELTEEQFTPFINHILKKGLISSQKIKNIKEAYLLSPILVGWFEVYLSGGDESDQRKEFAESFEKYFSSRRFLNFFPLRNYLNYKFIRSSKPNTRIVVSKKETHTKIVVNKKIEVEPVNIYPSQNVFELIEKYGEENKIAVIHCFCRQWKKMIGNPCSFNMSGESCIIIGETTKNVVKHKIGRNISKQEAIDIISETHKKGAIHQVFHRKEDLSLPEIAICNCCWDCCGILSGYNRGLLPLCIKSYYYAELSDSTQCTGCGKCKKYCPVNAVLIKKKKCTIDKETCIGCGQCEVKCPKNLIKMIYKERDVFLPMLKKSKARIR
jgi:ferredoxin